MSTAGRFGVALGAGIVLMTALGVAVAVSYHPVRPRVLCAMPLGTGGHVVYFGYINARDDVVVEPLGADNRVSPRGEPPTAFLPGSSGNYPSAAFAVNGKDDEVIAWTLGPRTVRLDDDTPRCPIKTMTPPPEDVVWVAPKPEIVVPPPPIELPPPPPPPPELEPPPEVAEVKPPPPPKARAPREKTVKRELIDKMVRETPVPLTLKMLGTVDSGNMAIEAGEANVFGAVGAMYDLEEDGIGQLGGVLGGIEGGTGDLVPQDPPKRVAAKVKVRPQGEWPADAPPRAGSVLVRLSLRVGTDGVVKQVRVVRGAGPAFDREARAVGMRARFEPATVDGEPVESWVPWDVEFTPDDF